MAVKSHFTDFEFSLNSIVSASAYFGSTCEAELVQSRVRLPRKKLLATTTHYFGTGAAGGSSFDISTTQRHCPSASKRQIDIPLR